MLEQIEQLAQRLESLVNALEESQREKSELEQRNAALEAKIEELNAVGAQKKELEEHVLQLEIEIEGMAQREGKIRERLQTMLSRIDTIETEIGGAAT